jgi:hypothetical protein
MCDWSALVIPQKTTLDSMRDSYPIAVSHLSFIFLFLLAALVLYLNDLRVDPRRILPFSLAWLVADCNMLGGRKTGY